MESCHFLTKYVKLYKNITFIPDNGGILMKILVVDDSKLNLAVAQKHLEENKRVTEIVLCSKPENAKSIIDEKNIDILILDIVMPVLTGFDLLEILRSDNKYDDLPIIMFTTLNDAESYSRCFDLGASDYINKPINEVEFNARIKAAIDARMASNHLKELLNVTEAQNKELKEINAKLTDTRFHLVQADKMAAIGQLAAGIAHEINNPMGFISSNFEILETYLRRLSEYVNFVNNCLLSSETPKIEFAKLSEDILAKYKILKIELVLQELEGILSDSENGVKRVTEIVQSLRAFARTAKDDDKDMYSLLDLINQVLLICKNEVKYVADISINLSEELVVYCNKGQIGQVLLNILINAAQAIQSQKREQMGLIKISADADEDYINIYIEDNGPGMPEEHLGKIFEPFFTTKDIGNGTGLGLSISYDIIVNKHNGIIDVTTKLGKGTTFTIKLPVKYSMG